jgi:hypothetical protein
VTGLVAVVVLVLVMGIVDGVVVVVGGCGK